jgi:hypothetical protein
LSTCYLLDVNVLIAVAWPTHQAHEKVQQWLGRHARQGWATCPLTQNAFVRILANPAFSPSALTPVDAMMLLRANLAHPFHQFWEDSIPFDQAAAPFSRRLVGHQQVSDAYLLGLAIHKKGTFVTLDRAVLSLLPEGSSDRNRVVVI